jgi:hypothetical protein
MACLRPNANRRRSGQMIRKQIRGAKVRRPRAEPVSAVLANLFLSPCCEKALTTHITYIAGQLVLM